MSRTISQIQQQIINQKNSISELSSLNSTSQTAIWLLFTYIQAVAINIFENILDIFKSDIETTLVPHVSGTETWIRNQISLFQFSGQDPQQVIIDNSGGTYAITYPVINASLRIVTQSTVSVLDNNLLIIKVAKQTPPVPLDVVEKSQLQSYLEDIIPAGIFFDLVSLDSDKLYIEGEIFYNGLYSGVIQTNVEDAINSYLQNLPFGGRFYVAQLEHAIISITGVKDVNISRISVRRDIVAFNYSTNTLIYKLEGSITDVNSRFADAYSGYFTTETTTSYTISDSITYTIQN